MLDNGALKVVVIDKCDRLFLRDEMLCYELDGIKNEIALCLIKSLIFESRRQTITVALLSELAQRNIDVLFCNERKLPVAYMHGIYSNGMTSCKIMQQAKWDSNRKEQLWNKIVHDKLFHSSILLEDVGCCTKSKDLLKLADSVIDDDLTNNEAVGANIYFHALFGQEFRRRDENNINIALNYGYAVLAAHITRCLVALGYSTTLGIHHKSSANPYNLTYDFIEPFRFFVDMVVYHEQGKSLDIEYKKKLINIMDKEVYYKNRKYALKAVIEKYCEDCLRFLNDGKNLPGKITFKK